MLLLRGYRYRAYPVGAEHEVFARWFGCCRFVKNWSRRRRVEAWEKEGKSLGYQDLAAELPGLKLLHPWLCEVPNQILQQALIDSDKAFQRFFRKEAGFPDWARRFEDDSARFPAVSQRQRVFDESGDVKLDADGKEVWKEHALIDLGQDTIDLPKIGKLRWSRHRPMEGKPSSVTITLEGGQYYISVTCAVEVPDPVFSTPFVADGGAIKVDVDLLDYLSDGMDFGVIRNWCDARGGVFDVPGWRPGEDIRKLRLERGIGRQEEARKEREKEARDADCCQPASGCRSPDGR
jgi:transposase